MRISSTNVHQNDHIHRTVNTTFPLNIIKRHAEKIVANQYFDGGSIDITEYGSKIWKNYEGQIHRIDGPAVERSSGKQEWWMNGVQYSESLFNDQLFTRKFYDSLALFADNKLPLREWLGGIDKFRMSNLFSDSIVIAEIQDKINQDKDPQTLAPLLAKIPWEILTKMELNQDIIAAINQNVYGEKQKPNFRKFFSTIMQPKSNR